MSQLALGVDPEAAPVPEHRVRALASVLAGFTWPERGSFDALKKPQQALALETARDALTRLRDEAGL